jgi:hypothetical protein
MRRLLAGPFLLLLLLLLLLRAPTSVAGEYAAARTGPSAPQAAPSIKDNPGEQIAGPAHPEDPAGVAAWRASLTAWRARMLAKIDYNGSIYEVGSSPETLLLL